ncbi:hypothetical protein RF640_14715 [Kocuria sp. CPCC 205231]|uniref:hypothetical protein n=1 Tax=Kocuria sp. CPCC 205231 TaxID=3073551 RepID=UPI0034D6C71E
MAPLHPFSGDTSRTSGEQAFLDALAAHIDNWAIPGVPADSFEVIAQIHPLVVMTEVPNVAVPPGQCTLQIGYWDDGQGCRALEGEWGDDLLLDSHVYSRDGLTVFGLCEEPATYGALAGKWLECQLQRRVDRQDWIRNGKIVRSRWVLPDTGKRIAQTIDTNWFLRGAPNLATRVR